MKRPEKLEMYCRDVLAFVTLGTFCCVQNLRKFNFQAYVSAMWFLYYFVAQHLFINDLMINDLELEKPWKKKKKPLESKSQSNTYLFKLEQFISKPDLPIF